MLQLMNAADGLALLDVIHTAIRFFEGGFFLSFEFHCRFAIRFFAGR
jgi:hypothetical protein